jgi:hypothetical protein
MDLDIMASVQEHIIGNCLCVLGDAMAMPIGSMIAKFRSEFEAHIEAARARNYGEAPTDPAESEVASESALVAQGAVEAHTPPADSTAEQRGAGEQAPGEHAGEPGTHQGGL